MAGFALWLVARMQPSPGMFTLLFLLGNLPAAAAFTNQTPLLAVTLAQSLITGLFADVLVARYDPQPSRGKTRAFRWFAVARADDVHRRLSAGHVARGRHLVGLERRARLVDLVGRLRLCPEPLDTRSPHGVIAARASLRWPRCCTRATAWRYGYFRDELYFIACSKHLAWGYVDQPPLVAVAAWLSAPAGYQLLALRALPVLAAALTVYLRRDAGRARRRPLRAIARGPGDPAAARVSAARLHADDDVVRAVLLDARRSILPYE